MSQGPDGQNAVATPTISVVICAFTLERVGILAEAISAVRSQTRPPHEIVIAVDHSPELLAEVGRRWPDVSAVAAEDDPGLCGARNTGIPASSGDIVAFLDDDAVPSPTWLERMAAGYS